MSLVSLSLPPSHLDLFVVTHLWGAQSEISAIYFFGTLYSVHRNINVYIKTKNTSGFVINCVRTLFGLFLGKSARIQMTDGQISLLIPSRDSAKEIDRENRCIDVLI